MSSQPTVCLVVTISFSIISAILGSMFFMRSSSNIGLRSPSSPPDCSSFASAVRRRLPDATSLSASLLTGDWNLRLMPAPDVPSDRGADELPPPPPLLLPPPPPPPPPPRRLLLSRLSRYAHLAVSTVLARCCHLRSSEILQRTSFSRAVMNSEEPRDAVSSKLSSSARPSASETQSIVSPSDDEFDEPPPLPRREPVLRPYTKRLLGVEISIRVTAAAEDEAEAAEEVARPAAAGAAMLVPYLTNWCCSGTDGNTSGRRELRPSLPLQQGGTFTLSRIVRLSRHRYDDGRRVSDTSRASKLARRPNARDRTNAAGRPAVVALRDQCSWDSMRYALRRETRHRAPPASGRRQRAPRRRCWQQSSACAQWRAERLVRGATTEWPLDQSGRSATQREASSAAPTPKPRRRA